MYTTYQPPALHETTTAAKGRRYPAVSNFALREGRGNTAMAAAKHAHTGEEERAKSVETDAEPLSSEDERAGEKSAEPTPKSKRILDGMKRNDERIMEAQRKLNLKVASTASGAIAKSNKGETGTGSRRSQRKKLQDNPMELTLANGVDDYDDYNNVRGDVSDDGAAVLSWKQPTPKKRKIGIYRGSTATTTSSINIHPSGSKSTESSSPLRPGQSQRAGFKAPEGFKVPEVLPSGSLPVKNATFKLPSESITSSATTVMTEPATVFSHSVSPIRFRSRSGSVSSLSSLNSIGSLLLTQDEKDSLMVDDSEKYGVQERSQIHQKTARCPFCSASVRSIHLEEFTARHSASSTTTRLPSRVQQRFCREHRSQEARETWIQRGYPTINWTDLATGRVDRHLPMITSILRNNEPPSYYRAKLIEATTAPNTSSGGGGGGSHNNKNNRRTRGRHNLLQYLKEGVLDVVKHGYYGPRGAKVAAEAMTLRLSSQLAEVAQHDSLVRDCGAAGFVQAVLVPEMVERWVAEDRRAGDVAGADVDDDAQHVGASATASRSAVDLTIDDDERREIRKVLEMSSEIGTLVNEDEDVVVVVDGSPAHGA